MISAQTVQVAKAPTVALLPWGDVIEDYLDGIGVSLQVFCEEMEGGWLFGYIDALQQVGIQTVMVCFSSQLSEPVRWINGPTGAVFCVLPASQLYLRLRARMRDPYGWTLSDMFGESSASHRLYRQWMRTLLPYLATPLRALARTLKQESCDLILCQEYESARFDLGVILGKWLNLPVFATFQGGTWHRSRIERYLRPITLKACKGLVIATQAEIERVQAAYKLPARKVARIFNPLDISLWFPERYAETRDQLGIPASARVAVWHGRIDMHPKGLDVLLKAWHLVCKKRSSYTLRLLLIGTGSNAGVLHQCIDEMELKGIIWLDQYLLDREVMRRYLSAADVYVFPSRHEGFPVAPLEAMACGLPLVATAAPGIPDILESGQQAGGIIVPPENSEALAEALESLLVEADRSRAMGAFARSRVVSTFSPETVGAQLLTFFRKKGALVQDALY